jgi:hypothetical protein
MDTVARTNIGFDIKFNGVSWKVMKDFVVGYDKYRKRTFGETDQHKLYYHKLG